MSRHDNIFFIPAGDLLGYGKDDFVIVYSPLAESYLLMSEDEADNLRNAMAGNRPSDEYDAILKELEDYTPIENRNDQIRSCRDFVTLYVLPNYACNFKCSYCFASEGRDKQRLDISKLLRMIDWMLDRERTSERKIHITFLGGGEPALSFDVIKPAVEYGNMRALRNGFEVVWNIVTNGSLVTDAMLDFFKEENVVVRYSFEILRDIQERQRGDYTAVHESIVSACRKGMRPVIRSMITPINVDRIVEMVEIVAKEYPGVGILKFDPITDSSFGADLEKMEQFYKTYNDSFLKAKAKGEEYGIDVQCVVTRNLDSVISRFCAGEISLNAYGEITSCHRVSSPREAGYYDLRYGYVDNDGVHVDEQRFLEITSDKVDTKTNCAGCFLKYNCAGGCHAQNEQYTGDMQKIVCEYSRDLSRRELLGRLDREIKRETGKGIRLQIGK